MPKEQSHNSSVQQPQTAAHPPRHRSLPAPLHPTCTAVRYQKLAPAKLGHAEQGVRQAQNDKQPPVAQGKARSDDHRNAWVLSIFPRALFTCHCVQKRLRGFHKSASAPRRVLPLVPWISRSMFTKHTNGKPKRKVETKYKLQGSNITQFHQTPSQVPQTNKTREYAMQKAGQHKSSSSKASCQPLIRHWRDETVVAPYSMDGVHDYCGLRADREMS